MEDQIAQGFSWGPTVDPDDVMGMTAQSSGIALGGSAAGATADARTAAAAAALRRMDRIQGGSAQRAPPSPVSGGAERASGVVVGVSDEISRDIVGLGHRDRDTERLERAMERLGSVGLDTVEPTVKSSAVRSGEVAEVASEDTSLTEAFSEAMEEPPLKSTLLTEEQPAALLSDVAMLDESEMVSVSADPDVTATADTQMLAADQSDFGPAVTDGRQVPDGLQQIPVEHSTEEADVSFESSVSPATDDGASERYQRLQRALQSLQNAAATEAEASAALSTLATILRNALSAPQDTRFRRVRQANPAFSRRVGRFPQALEVLKVAGFQPAAADDEGPVLMLQRDDPGLLWLALSAVQTAMASG